MDVCGATIFMFKCIINTMSSGETGEQHSQRCYINVSGGNLVLLAQKSEKSTNYH